MDFLIPKELREFRRSLQKLLVKDGLRATAKSFDAHSASKSLALDEKFLNLWAELSQLGAFLGCLGEDFGGLGFDLVAAQLMLLESARVLSPLPLFETVALGIYPLSLMGDELSRAELLPKIGQGEVRASGAFQDFFGRSNAPPLSAKIKETRKKKANEERTQYLLSGSATLVPSVEVVDIILVPAIIDSCDKALFLVKRETFKNLEIIRQPSFDLVRCYYRLNFKDTEAELLSTNIVPDAAWQELSDCIAILASAEMLGVGQTALDMSVEYAKTRKQFSKPIGSFQVISHKLADMHLELQSATTLLHFAAWSRAGDKAQFSQSAAAIKAYASEIAPKVAERAIQIHGGIGFTYEYDLHLFLRRAITLASCYGDKNHHYKRVAELELASS